MFAMDLSPRGDDGVEAYVRSFEPNQVQLVGHRMMGPLVSGQRREVETWLNPIARVSDMGYPRLLS
jgi:hypothetical protein